MHDLPPDGSFERGDISFKKSNFSAITEKVAGDLARTADLFQFCTAFFFGIKKNLSHKTVYLLI